MATKCDICGKGTTFGRNIRHHHTGRWERKAPRTNRTFKANVQVKKLLIGTVTRRVHICTRCIRSTAVNVMPISRNETAVVTVPIANSTGVLSLLISA